MVAEESVKARIINLLHAVRTLLRSKFPIVEKSNDHIESVPLIFANAFVILISMVVG